MYRDRYVYDALYGRISLPEYVWNTVNAPELQRLREVRLCNINSLCLTGGANVNRYEHSIGTAYLALRCTNSSLQPAANRDLTRRRIVLAALLHDVGSPAFGHSVQYLLDLQGYQHDSLYDILKDPQAGPQDDRLELNGYSYQHARFEPVFFGAPKRLHELLTKEELKAVAEMIAGRGPYGALINGSVDLDNIDNVYRLSYHIGLARPGSEPLRLAESLSVRDGDLLIHDDAVDLLAHWYETRRTLYVHLLLNPDEFSAKCMLEEALALAQLRSESWFSWHDVDYELLMKLSACCHETAEIVSRLMLGDLYGCVGIYSTENLKAYDIIMKFNRRRELEQGLDKRFRAAGVNALRSATAALHAIKDVNKTHRQVTASTLAGAKIRVGSPTSRILLGVFLKNKALGMTSISEDSLLRWKLTKIAGEYLSELFDDPALECLKPYAEGVA